MWPAGSNAKPDALIKQAGDDLPEAIWYLVLIIEQGTVEVSNYEFYHGVLVV